MQRPQTATEPFKMQRFKDTKSQVREWIEKEGYMQPQGEGALQRPATASGYIRKGEGESSEILAVPNGRASAHSGRNSPGQRRGPACRESMLEVRGITEVQKREKVPPTHCLAR
jgi:hypothetical protein